jgi:S-(hydroxymethyl)glutathione dehydrogenase/alcohol dehydrogenase
MLNGLDLPKSTRAAVLISPNEPLRIEELDLPDLLPGQVLVQMLYSGICQTQLLEVRGKKGKDPYLPHLLGHEGSAKVLAIGSGVQKVKAEDFVVLSWIPGKGIAAPGPKLKRKNGDLVNAGPVTTLTEFSIVSENRCTAISKDFRPDLAALLGCAVPTGAGIILNRLKIRPGDSVGIIGLGGVGLSAVIATKLVHAGTIAVFDIDDKKLKLAENLGANYLVNVRNETQMATFREHFKQGLDFAIEASGKKQAMELGFEIIKKSGSFLIAGNLAQGEKIQINPFDLILGKKISGTVGGETEPDRDLPLYCNLALQGLFPMEKLVQKTSKLEDINELFNELETGLLGRILVKF